MTGNNQMSVLQAGDSEKLFLYLFLFLFLFCFLGRQMMSQDLSEHFPAYVMCVQNAFRVLKVNVDKAPI